MGMSYAPYSYIANVMIQRHKLSSSKLVLRRNLIANFVGQGWTAIMGFAFIPAYIYFLGIESYGLIGIFTMLTAWFTLLDLGMTPTLGREMARFTGGVRSTETTLDLLRSIEILAFFAGTAFFLLIVAGADSIANNWLNNEKLPAKEISNALVLMGWVTALRFFEGVYRSALLGLQRQVQFNIINSALATLRHVGALAVLAWFTPTIEGFFYWQALVSLIAICVLAVATYNSIPEGVRSPRFSMSEIRSIYKYAGGMAAISLLTLILTQIDKLLLSNMLTLSNFGVYTLAATVASLLYVLITPINQAWFPRLSELQSINNEKLFIKTFHQGAQFVTVLAGSATATMVFFADSFLEIWTQDTLLAAKTAPLLSLLLLGNFFNTLCWIPYQAQLAHGWTSLAIKTNLLACLVLFPSILFFTPTYGAIAVAFIWVALNLGYISLSVWFMFSKILKKERINWYLYDVALPTAVAFFCAFVLSKSLHAEETLYKALALFFTGLLTFLITLLTTSEVRQILNTEIRKRILK